MCLSKSSGSPSSRRRDVDLAPDPAATRSRTVQGATPGQASTHLSALSDLNRNRLSAANAGASAPQRQRTAVLSPASQPAPSVAQAAVTDVLKFVRDTYYRPHLKSGNKVHRDGGPEETQREERATREVRRIRAQPDLLAAAMQGEAHQCQELALLALHHLEERGLRARMLEMGGNEFTVAHAVAIIGPASNPLPTSMKLWHPDVFVCDPWSNIACRGRDYPDQFAEKMKKWERAGKMVGHPTAGELAPTDPGWLRDVLRGPKIALLKDEWLAAQQG